MDGDQRRSFSLLHGDGLYFNRIISRKSSVGQSSRIYYRTAEGVPFKWEMQPGTSKNQPEEEESTPFSFPFPPLSPPPQLQNKLLPLPNPCHHQDQPKNRNKFFGFLKRIKISEHYEKLAHQSLSRKRCTCTGKQSNDQSRGDFISSLINHSCSSSSTLSSSTNHGLSLSRSSSSSSVKRESLDDTPPFCCSPWNITAIMEEGNRRVYYCRDHNTAFAIEKDGSFLSKVVLSRVSSSVDHRSSFHRIGEGIPFQWETKPGRPIHPPEEEVIPPPTPPPALQSLIAPPLPSPRVHDSVKTNKISGTFWNWIKTKKMKKARTLFLSASNDDTCRRDSSVSRSSSSSISILRLNSEEQLKLSRHGKRDLFSGQSCFNF